jgi:hypothetical protein
MIQDKLTSRKFLSMVAACVFAVAQFTLGNIDGNVFMASVVAAVSAYGVAEGIADHGRG